MAQIDDAATAQSLAADIIRLIKRRQAVQDAGNVYTSPEDPEITFNLTIAQVKVKYSDAIDAKWAQIKALATKYSP